MFTVRNMVLIFFAAVIFSSCSPRDLTKERAKKAGESQGPIFIALVWPVGNKDLPFLNGASLAIEEINESGGIMGRKLQAIIFDEPEDGEGYTIAAEVVKNENIVAIIGHSTSAAAIPASITYENNGLLFLAPSSSNPALTAHDFQYVFRTCASDTIIGRRMAKFSQNKGYHRIVILDDNTIYGQGVSSTFYTTAVDLGLKIISHKAYFKWQTDYKYIINDFTKLEFDAIFLAGIMPHSAKVIKQSREMGISVPFISGDSLDFPNLPIIAGPASEGTIVPTVFNPNSDIPLVRKFTESFQKRFHAPPHTWEALGYDSVNLLAFAFEKSDSIVPIVVSSKLRFTKQWQGVTGEFSYDLNGELGDKRLFFKEIHNGQFKFIKE